MPGEPTLAGRLAPEAMFPAGQAAIRTRRAALPDGVELRVAESGPTTGLPILLLHGWGASIYMWRDWFAPLAAAGRRVIAIDLPGHGLSDKPGNATAYSLAGMVTSVREFLDVERIGRVDIVAQSMAGTIAIELALAGDARVATLALVNPACFGRIRLQRLARAVSPAIVDAILPRLVGRWVVARAHQLVYGDPSKITRHDEDEYWAPSQFPSYTRAMRRLLHEFTWTRPVPSVMAGRLRGLGSSVLVVLGMRDRLVREAGQYVTALISEGAPLVVREVSAGGHAVNEEWPQEVVHHVLSFMADRRSTT
ncbi:MAG: alpha/beta fold hydrolase [Gemmatimonadaceae bacterium]